MTRGRATPRYPTDAEQEGSNALVSPEAVLEAMKIIKNYHKNQAEEDLRNEKFSELEKNLLKMDVKIDRAVSEVSRAVSDLSFQCEKLSLEFKKLRNIVFVENYGATPKMRESPRKFQLVEVPRTLESWEIFVPIRPRHRYGPPEHYR